MRNKTIDIPGHPDIDEMDGVLQKDADAQHAHQECRQMALRNGREKPVENSLPFSLLRRYGAEALNEGNEEKEACPLEDRSDQAEPDDGRPCPGRRLSQAEEALQPHEERTARPHGIVSI